MQVQGIIHLFMPSQDWCFPKKLFSQTPVMLQKNTDNLVKFSLISCMLQTIKSCKQSLLALKSMNFEHFTTVKSLNMQFLRRKLLFQCFYSCIPKMSCFQKYKKTPHLIHMTTSPTENTLGVTFSDRKHLCFSVVSHILSHSNSEVAEGEWGLSPHIWWCFFPPQLSMSLCYILDAASIRHIDPDMFSLITEMA